MHNSITNTTTHTYYTYCNLPYLPCHVYHHKGGMSEAEKQKAEDDDDAKELVQTIKAMTGLFDDDPPDSDWMHFTKHDHNTNAFKPMGSVCYSVQIWPKDKAVAMPVGAGRNEPNNNPYLPPPVGRLKWSWNPFVLGSELCGPKICSSIFCCLICIAFVLLMVFCQVCILCHYLTLLCAYEVYTYVCICIYDMIY